MKTIAEAEIPLERQRTGSEELGDVDLKTNHIFYFLNNSFYLIQN